MADVERKSEGDGPAPFNDNFETANDNDPYLRRCEYMRDYMARRRHGGKTQRQLLKEAIAFVEALAPADDIEAQMFVAAVKDVLKEKHRQ